MKETFERVTESHGGKSLPSNTSTGASIRRSAAIGGRSTTLFLATGNGSGESSRSDLRLNRPKRRLHFMRRTTSSARISTRRKKRHGNRRAA